MQQSVFESFMSRLPAGANVYVSGAQFDFDGQILEHDETFLIISDGESMQLVRIDTINDINYVLPDAPLEVVAQ
jgi:hypothetical protein